MNNRDCYHSFYSLSDLKKIRDNFVNELVRALNGRKNSLAFIKNPLPKKTVVNNNQIFQVMVIGGSVFEKALVTKQEKNFKILSYYKESLPIFKNKKIFLSFVEKRLNPKINVLVVNFAYALKPILRNNRIDGIKLTTTSKEHKFEGLINKLVGQEIEDHIFKKHKTKIKVIVANDTVCLILSGLIRFDWKNLVAGVIGSGTNFSFFLDKKTIINLESGNFNKLRSTETGLEIDEKSANPTKYLFEKEVAGRYLYQHYNLLKPSTPLSSTKELDLVAKDIKHPDSNLARQLLERSASLIACQIAGIYFFKKFEARNSKHETITKIRNPNIRNTDVLNLENSYLEFVSDFGFRISSFQLTLIIEGSLFWKGWHYEDKVKEYLKKLSVPKNGIKFIEIKNSSIVGAYQLVL